MKIITTIASLNLKFTRKRIHNTQLCKKPSARRTDGPLSTNSVSNNLIESSNNRFKIINSNNTVTRHFSPE